MRFLYPWAAFGLALIAVGAWWVRREWARQGWADRLALAMRGLALLVLVAALTGPQVASRQGTRYVYFVVDRSASARLAAGDAEVIAQLRRLATLRAQTHYGVIVFGQEAYVDQPLSPQVPAEIHTEVDPGGSDLAGALRLALETLPSEGTREVVLLSDGLSTGTDIDTDTGAGGSRSLALAGVLQRARREGVRISVRPLHAEAYEEYRLEALRLPAEVEQGIPFVGEVALNASAAAQGTLLIYRDGSLLSMQTVALEPGSSLVSFSDTLEAAGHHRYRAYLKVEGDTLVENNALSGLVYASGEAAVLLLERDAASGEPLARLLGASGHRLERRVLGEAPSPLSLADLAGYRAVILNNVPIASLDEAFVRALREYVRQLGGGLWLIQGRAAVEGVSETPLEAMLPVRYEGPQREQLPNVAIVFVLDKSSSMSATAGTGLAGISKLDVLKEAAAAGIEVLRPEDLVGIIAFDSSFRWLVPLQPVRDKAAIYAQIRQLRTGGGTDLYFPLEEAYEALRRTPARLKHIVVFSDGKTVREGRDYDGLFERLSGGEITISSIGLGQQPDKDLLNRLAEAGQGKLYLVQDIQKLPQVSVKETRRIAKRRWVTGTQTVTAGPYAPRLGVGVDPAELPSLEGYVRTYDKPLAQRVLSAGESEDPLLSLWQYGLGQVAVLNTDLEGLWSRSWLAWPQISALAEEILAQVYSGLTADARFAVHPTLEGRALTLAVDVRQGGRWSDLLTIFGRLVAVTADAHAQSPPNTQEEAPALRFTQEGPGRYVSEEIEVRQGLYLLHLRAFREGGGEGGSESETWAEHTAAVAVPYSEEYRRLASDETTLEEIASATGGAFLEGSSPRWGLHLPPPAPGPVRYRDLWPWGMGLALALFLGDLFLRKLPLGG